MIITAWDYADFKKLVTDLTSSPKIYGNTDESAWRAQCIENGLAIIIRLPEEPEAFATDYPSHFDFNAAITVS